MNIAHAWRCGGTRLLVAGEGARGGDVGGAGGGGGGACWRYVVQEGWWERFWFWLLFSPAGSASSVAPYNLSAVMCSLLGLPPRASPRPARLPRAPCALAPCLPRKAVSTRPGAGAAVASQHLKAPPARPLRGSPTAPQRRVTPLVQTGRRVQPHARVALAGRVTPARRLAPPRRPCAPGAAHVGHRAHQHPCTRSVESVVLDPARI